MRQKKSKASYKRILIKISGEILAGHQGFGLNSNVLKQISSELKQISELGVQIAVVIGGGNIFRGVEASKKGMERVSSDHMGMLATCINALALQNMLEQNKVFTRVLSAIEISDMAEPYIHRRALRHLEKKPPVDFFWRYRKSLLFNRYGFCIESYGNLSRCFAKSDKS